MLSMLFSIAQNSYDKIVDTTKMWVVISDVSPIYNFKPSTVAYKFKDSIKLSDGSYWYSLCESKDEGYKTWKFMFYAREIDSIVICNNCITDNSSNIDTLYNFKKKIGGNLNPRTGDEVILTDTLTDFFAEKKRFKQIISDWNGYNYEGIGNTQGLLKPLYYNYTGSNSKILCYFKEDELLYKDSNYGNCYISTNINDIEDSENIKIFPNPSNDFITIIYPTGWLSGIDIKVYNLLGVLVFEELNFINSSNIVLSQKGIYFVTVKHDKLIHNELLIIK